MNIDKLTKLVEIASITRRCTDVCTHISDTKKKSIYEDVKMAEDLLRDANHDQTLNTAEMILVRARDTYLNAHLDEQATRLLERLSIQPVAGDGDSVEYIGVVGQAMAEMAEAKRKNMLN